MENLQKRPKINSTLLTKYLFSIYLIALIWIVLLKMSYSLATLPSFRAINLIPFSDSTIINQKINLSEIYMNVIIFIPFGIYMTMLKPKWTFFKLIIPIAFTSFLVETLQYTFAIGATDITDLIGNTLGGIIGILIYVVMNKLFKNKITINKIFNVLALIGTIGFIFLFTIIFLVNA